MPFKSAAVRAEHNRAWRQKNRFATATSARAKALRLEYGGSLSTADVRSALGELCAYCGSAPSEALEHCTPLSRGGENEPWNVVGACQECNDLKGRKTALEFFGLWPSKNLTRPPF